MVAHRDLGFWCSVVLRTTEMESLLPGQSSGSRSCISLTEVTISGRSKLWGWRFLKRYTSSGVLPLADVMITKRCVTPQTWVTQQHKVHAVVKVLVFGSSRSLRMWPRNYSVCGFLDGEC